MKIGVRYIVAAAALLGACASEPHPYKRPLSLEYMPLLANANVVIVENNTGVETTWFERDTATYMSTQYGLIGALVAGGMDAAANGGPSRAAQFVADDIATVVVAETLNKSLENSLAALKTSAPADGIGIGEIKTRQAILQPTVQDGAVEVSVSYKLSADGSALTAAATAIYQRPDVKYKTPYAFKSPPSDELEGPLYRNTFVYESSRLPLPKLTPELKTAMVETVKNNWITKRGSLPVSTKKKTAGYGEVNRENTDFKDMSWEIDQANDDILLPAESSNLLADEWLKVDGAFLKQEIEAAHAFIAKYLVLDLNSADVPSLTGTTRVLEQLPSGRTVRMLGSGVDSGAYVSSPGGLQEVTTFGNASQIADRNLKRITQLQETAKTQGNTR